MMSRRLRHARRSTGLLPHFEPLELRYCPSCTLSTFDSTLIIRGDASSNDISLFDDGRNEIEVHCDGAVDFFDGIDTVFLKARGGNDHVEYRLDPLDIDAAGLEASMFLRIGLGSGDDDAVLDFSDMGDLAILADLDVRVNGGIGDDFVEASFGGVDSALVTVRARLGAGNDEFRGFLDGDLTTSADVLIQAEGGSGHDIVDFMALGPPDLLSVFVEFGSVLELDLFGDSGNDSSIADVTIDSASEGSVFLSVEGNSGDDDVSLGVFDESGVSLDTTFLDDSSVVLDGGPGHDVCEATDNVDMFSCEDLFVAHDAQEFSSTA